MWFPAKDLSGNLNCLRLDIEGCGIGGVGVRRALCIIIAALSQLSTESKQTTFSHRNLWWGGLRLKRHCFRSTSKLRASPRVTGLSSDDNFGFTYGLSTYLAFEKVLLLLIQRQLDSFSTAARIL